MLLMLAVVSWVSMTSEISEAVLTWCWPQVRCRMVIMKTR